MSDEISRKIAEFFEPKPTFENVTVYCGQRPEWFDEDIWVNSDLYASDGQWWLRTYSSGGVYSEWKPVPYTDPEIVVRLLKWLVEAQPEHRLTLEWIGKLEDHPGWEFELRIAQATIGEIERRSR